MYNQYLKALNIIDAANKGLGNTNQENLMETWNRFRDGLVAQTSNTNTYLVSCMKYLDTEKYANKPSYFIFENC